jgi:large subunit ribosomal protein L1
MAKTSKNLRNANAKLEPGKYYSIQEAAGLVKSLSYEKFDATVELAIRLNVDPRQADQNIRGAVSLPHGTGKTLKVLAFVQGDKVKEAKDAGADFIGDDDMIQKIQKGIIEFDAVVATPDMMGKIAPLGKTLGPRGLMPNPKTGTVTNDIAKVVAEVKSGKIEYRNDKVGNVQVPVGKVSFSAEQLAENVKAVYQQLIKVRPSTVKGTYVLNAAMSSSMGPGVKISFESLDN